MVDKSIGTIKSAIILCLVWFVGVLAEFALVHFGMISKDVASSGLAMFFGMMLGFAALYLINR